ncbi:MAG: FmdE family protein [Treponema sp.]|jgi:formylmethanofuran dehydrogenase subunit E|nr:FmdE family protein [Treponema sp.]
MNSELWNRAKAFHGHECPGLAIGVKACEAAMERLGIGRASDEEALCVAENDACGVDAVQAILGCTVGKGSLIFRNTGKQVFTFVNRDTGQAVRLYLKARRDKDTDRGVWQQYLLDAPPEEIFEFSAPQFEIPETARIFPSVPCDICGEYAAEHRIRLQEGKKVCMDCFRRYSRGWGNG